MPSPGFSPDDQDEMLAAYYAGRKPLSSNIASIQRNGATIPDVGFSPDDPVDGPLSPPMDRAAFRVGTSAPESFKRTPSAGAGKVLLGRSTAPSQPPPQWTPPPPAPPRQPPPAVSDDPGQANVAVTTPPVNPQVQALLDQQKQLAANPPHEIGETDAQGKPLRPQDIDPNTGKLKTGAKVASWAQRLGLAALAATKLAPYAQQIIHPEYSQQVAAQSAAQKAIQEELTNQEKAANTEYLGGLHQEQASLAAAKADPHYGRVQVDPDYAKENLPWLQPEIGQDGNPQYWIDKGAENTLTKPIPPSKLISIPEGGSLYDQEQGKIVATGSPKMATGDAPLGQRVDQMNQILASRYQVLHPGKPLPPQYGLATDATQKDYDRIDKGLEAEERATATVAQQQILNEARRQNQILAQSAAADRKEAAGQHRSDQSYQFNVNELNKVAKPVDELLLRFGRLEDTLAQGTPQADALIAPELLTVMAGGQGSGMRMNEAEIQRIVGGRSNWETLKADINKWQLDPSKARTITPAQQQQIKALMGAVGEKLRQKQAIVTDARSKLLMSDDPAYHRQIVAGAQTAFNNVDSGQHGTGKIVVTAPDGSTHPFDTQAQADAFKVLAGIK